MDTDIVILRLLCLGILFGIVALIIKPFLHGSIVDYVTNKTADYLIPENEVVNGETVSTEKKDSKDKPISVIVKGNNVDADKIVEYDGEHSERKFEFRPEKWVQFIGQEEAKERAKTLVKKAEMMLDKGLKAHFLVDGIKGHGKTTYVELFAKDIDAHLIERIGKHVNEDNLVDIINEINTVEAKHVVFFIDEIDSMDWKVIKALNTMIESFKLSGKRIRPFIFVGATINKHILVKNNPDTLDRIPTHIKFVRYNAQELKTILKQYKEQLYPEDTIKDEIYDIIANNCKYNPRTGISLLSDYIVEFDIDRLLKNWNIIKDGLNNVDIKVLTALNESKRAIGANSLALRCGLSEKEYITEVEPFLLEFGYVNRVPSRVITEKGKKFLQEVITNVVS